jgi:hypothetical protein
MIKIKVSTLFDITTTGVTGHYKSSRDNITADQWNRARNQQRNYETLTQLISLRTQIDNITPSQAETDKWEFEFTIEQDVFNDGADPVGVLKQDAGGIPMLRELDNDPDIDPVLITQGLRQNIWFTIEPINSILEN